MIISLYNACTDQTIILETKTITIGRGFFCVSTFFKVLNVQLFKFNQF